MCLANISAYDQYSVIGQQRPLGVSQFLGRSSALFLLVQCAPVLVIERNLSIDIRASLVIYLRHFVLICPNARVLGVIVNYDIGIAAPIVDCQVQQVCGCNIPLSLDHVTITI